MGLREASSQAPKTRLASAIQHNNQLEQPQCSLYKPQKASRMLPGPSRGLNGSSSCGSEPTVSQIRRSQTCGQRVTTVQPQFKLCPYHFLFPL